MIYSPDDFPKDWPESLRVAMSKLNKPTHNTRVRIHGKHWDSVGYLSFSTGPAKTPLLVHNRRSSGGNLLPTGILKVESSRKGGPVYWDMKVDEPVLWIMNQ